jgi:hypothetical protein
MTIGALMLRGVPPSGLGLYSRNRPDAQGAWAFRVWHNARDWGFMGVEQSTPDAWARELPRAVERARQYGQRGIVVDPENGWADVGADEWRAFGLALREVAREFRVGVTSFPQVPRIEALFEAAGASVWGSPQLYFAPEVNARGWDRWRAMCGNRLIPSVKGYVQGRHTTPALAAWFGSESGYREYVDSLPTAAGCIVWPVHPMPGYMVSALESRYAGPRAVALAPSIAINTAASPAGFVLAALVLAALAFAAVKGTR